MSANRPPKKPVVTNSPSATAFAAADYPALRSFLRGYFHQDMKDEYGSAEEAVREFCADASGDERVAVAEEWSRFVDTTKGQPIEAINRILTGPLGSSYILTPEDVQRISALLFRCTNKSKKR
ncbi:MAG: contact-dependent growth inhibition system immunity protein [Candidatus Sulfotelmatobacter sp.]